MTEKQCENCNYYDEDIDTQPCCSCKNNENFEADRNVGGKMESKDIIQALERCTEKGCNIKCQLYDETQCEEKLMKNALDLIKNQQAKIKRLKDDLLESNIEIAELYKCKFSAEDVAQNIVIAKTEAYKEVFDRLERLDFEIVSKVLSFDLDEYNEIKKELTERKED